MPLVHKRPAEGGRRDEAPRPGGDGPDSERLCRAAHEGNLDAVKELLTEGADANARVPDGSRRTALHFACAHFSHRYVPIAALLLHCGADARAEDADGATCLDYATNPQIGALVHAHKDRLAAARFTPRERVWCTETMARQWASVGGRALWRLVVLKLLEKRIDRQHRELEGLPIDLTHIDAIGAADDGDEDGARRRQARAATPRRRRGRRRGARGRRRGGRPPQTTGRRRARRRHRDDDSQMSQGAP